MKRMMTMLLTGLALAAGAANAGASEREMLQQVAKEAGVSIDEVRMVLGSRTDHARYRTSYDRIEARVKAALAEVTARQESPRQDAQVASASK